MPHSHPLQEQILAGRGSIFTGWLGAVRDQIPASRARPDGFLVDDLDRFLINAADIVDCPERRESYQEAVEDARRHGEHRAGFDGYDVSQIILEYTLLREKLFAHLEAGPLGLATETSRTLSRLFEAAIGISVEEFVTRRQGESRGSGHDQLAARLADRAISPRAESLALVTSEGRSLDDQRAQVAANRELARFVAQSPMPMALMLGPELEFVLVNAPYERFIQRRPLGRTVARLFTAEERADFEANLQRVFETGLPFIANEYPLRRLDAEGVMRAYMMNVAYHPFRDRDGRTIGVLAFMNDVTPEVNARRRARESAERLRAVFAHAAVGFSVTSTDGAFVETNPRFCELTGYEGEELASMNFADLLSPEDRARERAVVDDLEAGRVAEAVTEKVILRKGGLPVWVRDSTSLIPGPLGRPLAFRVSEDVTAFREADRRRRESEERYEKLADSMPQIVWTADAEGRLDYFNAVWFHFSGSAPDDRGGWLAAIHPEDLKNTLKVWTHSVKTGARYDMEFRLRDRHGDFRWHVTRAVPVRDVRGKVERWFGTCTDIHAAKSLNHDLERARREAEESAERFRIAVETADMGTWDIDPETRMLRWSERASGLFGMPGTTEVPMDEAMERVHPDDRVRVRAEVARALDPSGTGDHYSEHRTLLPDGQTRWISVLAKAFFADGPNGRCATRFTGVILDVTDRMAADLALRDAKERAELASAAKSAFLANMSHEIRTPLGAIMGFVGLMREENLDRASMLEFATVIERNSAQLMRIIDDILDLSKVEAGMMMIEHIEFSLVELLSDFASLMQFRAREKGIDFALQARSELPDLVRADPVRMRQILNNVVGNAIKFTERGSVHLFVDFAVDAISFEVVDTGRGITAAQAENLFQPFSQADASTTRQYGGTGLGLVLTRRLSEAMGGSFELRASAPGRGSTFVARVLVEVPARGSLVNALGFKSEPARTGAPSVPLHDLRVLLVEDSPDNQALFSIYLDRAGARVDIAEDGARGVELAMADGGYDVVLMDVQMPVMDGVTAVRTLRERGFTKPIVALTAHAMKEERARCLAAGYTEFLSKPVARGDLVEALVKYSPSAG